MNENQPKKRGRKPKKLLENDNNTQPIVKTDEKVHKKRGRKPKGGKIIEKKNK